MVAGTPLEPMNRMSRRYAGTDYPVRSAIVMVIKPERVLLQDLEAVPET